MLFDNPLKSILFLKDFFGYNDCFGLFTKIEKDSENSFDVHFLHDFSINMFFI